MYAQSLEGDSWRGDKLDKSKVEKMSDQQLAQLYELMQAIKKKEVASEEEITAHLEDISKNKK